jgi:hypothetical protein
MRADSRTIGMRVILLASVFLFAIGMAAAAEESGEPSEDFAGLAIRTEYAAEVQARGFAPSPLALRLALAEGKSAWQDLPAAEAARFAYEYAYRAERALRFGESAQEVRARLRQRLRLEARDGEGAERLELAERQRTRTQDLIRDRVGSAYSSAQAGGPSGRR